MTRASDTAKLLGAGATILDGTTISTADNTAQLTLTSTDADSNFGPLLAMYRNSSSPADADFLGDIEFQGENSAGETITYAQVFGRTGDVTDGTEDGRIATKIMVAGASLNVLDIKSDEIVINDDSADVDFRVESNGNANMLLVDGGNNRVGIGTASPESLLEVSDLTTTAAITIRSDRSGGGNLQFADQDDINVGYISYQHNNNRMVFRAGDNQQVYIDAAGCLLLGTTSPGSAGNGDLVVNGGAFIGGSAAANKLDDYEEGTWTPSIGGNASYIHQSGTYVKIGRKVFLSCDIKINVIGTGVATQLNGAPFAAMNTGFPQGGISIMYYDAIATAVTSFNGYMNNNNSVITFSGNTGTAATTIGLNGFNVFKNSARVSFSIAYQTA
jgi:hypothetical protein